MGNSTGPEPMWQKVCRVGLGWGVAGIVLFAPMPYPFPWWGRSLAAFVLISIAHSTVTGIVLRNLARSGPALIGAIRGVGIGNRRNNAAGGGGNADSTQSPPPLRRKSDRHSAKR